MTNNEYQVGDLVEAVEGETVIRTRVVKHPKLNTLHIDPFSEMNPDRWTYLDYYIGKQTRSITVIEKAKPKVELPSEPGYYSDRHDDIWEAHENGRWLCVSDNDYSGRVTEYAPFTRLEPRAVTVKAVLNAVTATIWPYGPTTFEGHDSLIEVAKEFGAVTR